MSSSRYLLLDAALNLSLFCSGLVPPTHRWRRPALHSASARAFGWRSLQAFYSFMCPHGKLEKMNGSFLLQVLIKNVKCMMTACQPSNYYSCPWHRGVARASPSQAQRESKKHKFSYFCGVKASGWGLAVLDWLVLLHHEQLAQGIVSTQKLNKWANLD